MSGAKCFCFRRELLFGFCELYWIQDPTEIFQSQPEKEKMSNLVSPQDRVRLQTHAQDVSENDQVDGRAADVQQLRKENSELKARVEEMEHAWLDSQREYENLLEEKSEVIRSLHQKIQELQSSGPLPTETGQQDELLGIQKELEADRERLQQDEESLMVQMRAMELSMAKERAELARQRTELGRLQAEFNREVELASRDADLRERLNGLQRNSQSALQRRQDQQVESARRPSAKEASPSEATPLPRKGNSGLLGRLFGK
jgi:hypothetical protein